MSEVKSTEVAAEFCKNCKRQVASKNYVLHSAHCERNIKLCPLCEEPVPILCFENHLQEDHRKDPCSYCRKLVEKCKLEEHKEECPSRPIFCEFCDLSFPAVSLFEHVVWCGSRTEECKICNHYIPLKDKSNHEKGCVKDNSTGIVECPYCKDEFELTSISSHCDHCFAKSNHSYEANNMADVRESKPRVQKVFPNTVKCSSCYVEVDKKTISSHLIKCTALENNCSSYPEYGLKDQAMANSPPKPTTLYEEMKKAAECSFEVHDSCQHCSCNIPEGSKLCENCKSGRERGTINKDNSFKEKKKSPDVYKKVDDTRSKDLATCPYCLTIFPIDYAEEHIKACGSILERCPDCSKNLPRREISSHSISCVKDTLSKNRNVCQFCYHEFLDDNISEHSRNCESQLEKCQLCLKYVKKKDMKRHQTMCKKQIRSEVLETCQDRSCDIPKEPELVGENGRLSRESESVEKNYTDTLLKNCNVCQFCYHEFPDGNISEHSRNCESQLEKCQVCQKYVMIKDKKKHQTICKGQISSEGHDTGSSCDVPIMSELYGKGRLGRESESMKKDHRNTICCPICKKEVPERNFKEHFECCKKSNYVCDMCCEVISISNKRNHVNFTCKYAPSPDISGFVTEKMNALKISSEQESFVSLEDLQCPYCENKFPSDTYGNHINKCELSKKMCKFCVKEILKTEEKQHLCCCPALIKEDEKETRAKSKKKKNKKPEKNERWYNKFSNLFTSEHEGVNEERKIYEYSRTEYAMLPCEFCNETFPDYLLIQHESGCRPDLVSLPQNTQVSPPPDHKKEHGDHISSLNGFKGTPGMSDATREESGASKAKVYSRYANESHVKPGDYLPSYSSRPRREIDLDSSYEDRKSQDLYARTVNQQQNSPRESKEYDVAVGAERIPNNRRNFNSPQPGTLSDIYKPEAGLKSISDENWKGDSFEGNKSLFTFRSKKPDCSAYQISGECYVTSASANVSQGRGLGTIGLQINKHIEDNPALELLSIYEPCEKETEVTIDHVDNEMPAHLNKNEKKPTYGSLVISENDAKLKYRITETEYEEKRLLMGKQDIPNTYSQQEDNTSNSKSFSYFSDDSCNKVERKNSRSSRSSSPDYYECDDGEAYFQFLHSKEIDTEWEIKKTCSTSPPKEGNFKVSPFHECENKICYCRITGKYEKEDNGNVFSDKEYKENYPMGGSSFEPHKNVNQGPVLQHEMEVNNEKWKFCGRKSPEVESLVNKSKGCKLRDYSSDDE